MGHRLKRIDDPRFLYSRLPWIVLSFVPGLAAVLGCVWQRPFLDPYAADLHSVFTWFWHPIERNAHLRLLVENDLQIPLEFRARSLYSVTMAANGRNVVAVGTDTILRSTNGGASCRNLRLRRRAANQQCLSTDPTAN